MMKSAATLALVALATAAPQVKLFAPEPSFDAWCKTFDKCSTFSDAEMASRQATYEDNVNFITKHNAKYARGDETYFMGVNEYSHMSYDEFRSYFNLGQQMQPRNSTPTPLPKITTISGTEASVDWRSKGAVTPIKNQGQCGSCWSFSSTGSMEGAVQIKTGKLTSLSEQQLMDCSKPEGNNGCQGGLMDYAFKYVVKNGGIDSEADYPYTAANGVCNKAKEARHVSDITGYTDVEHSESALMAAINKGPVSVAIEADQRAFQMYKGGVFSAECGTKLDHGVLAVGYGTMTSGGDYWIVKNSWGATWGDEGYIMMSRTAGGATTGECGILMSASFPLAGAPGPAPPPGPPGPPPPPPPPGPSSGHWADPNTGPCQDGDEKVQVTGLPGAFCSPKCGFLKKCPAAATGTAEAECVLETQGSSKPTQCALVCSPGAQNGGCPTGMTCEPISGTGICSFLK